MPFCDEEGGGGGGGNRGGSEGLDAFMALLAADLDDCFCGDRDERLPVIYCISITI